MIALKGRPSLQKREGGLRCFIHLYRLSDFPNFHGRPGMEAMMQTLFSID